MALTLVSYDQKGAKTSLSLDWLKPDKLAKPSLIAQVVRVFLGNQRRSMAKAKTRGQVDGSTKKIYKQKGTGGARHGSRKAPLFVGGGKAHGPTGKQNYSGQTNKKVAAKALLSVLVAKQKSDRLVLVNCPDFTKSGQADRYFSAIITGHKSRSGLLLVDPKTNMNCLNYCRNLAALTVVSAATVSVYEVIRADLVLVTNQALPALKHRGEIHDR